MQLLKIFYIWLILILVVKDPLPSITIALEKEQGAKFMKIENPKRSELTKTVSRAKAAFKGGQLDHYKPLMASGAEGVKSTCTASWGPAMRR